MMANVSIEIESRVLVTYKECEMIVGPGVRGNSIFKGFFNGNIPIAVKRCARTEENKEAKRDLEVLCSHDELRHPHIIRYFGAAMDNCFCYIFLELCECSVADVIDLNRRDQTVIKMPLPMLQSILINLSPKEIMRQSSVAVSFLHSHNKIHRKLHPDNFLISCVDSSKHHFIVKLSDFRFVQYIDENQLNSFSGLTGGWVAPESFIAHIKLTTKLDAYILGIFCFYVLSGGKHPFGTGAISQEYRITNEKDCVYQAGWDGKPEWNFELHRNGKEEGERAIAMIKDVIMFNPEERKSVDDILQSKYFQPVESYNIYKNSVSPRPGLCVIVTQSQYHNRIMDLDELEIDCRKLEKTFCNFGYEVLHFRNLSGEQLARCLSPANLEKETFDYSKEFASLVVCIMGHGDKDIVYGVDGIPVQLNPLLYAFNGEMLKAKPKIFIILACRGSSDQLTLDPKASCMVNKQPPASVTFTLAASVNKPTTAPLTDMLALMSNMEEFKSHLDPNRDPDMGTNFIDYLCCALDSEYQDKDPGNMDLVQLFGTVVVPKMTTLDIPAVIIAQNNSQTVDVFIKQTPESRSTLIKKIRFQPAISLGFSREVYDGFREDPSFQHARDYYDVRNSSAVP